MHLHLWLWLWLHLMCPWESMFIGGVDPCGWCSRGGWWGVLGIGVAMVLGRPSVTPGISGMHGMVSWWTPRLCPIANLQLLRLPIWTPSPSPIPNPILLSSTGCSGCGVGRGVLIMGVSRGRFVGTGCSAGCGWS